MKMLSIPLSSLMRFRPHIVIKNLFYFKALHLFPSLLQILIHDYENPNSSVRSNVAKKTRKKQITDRENGYASHTLSPGAGHVAPWRIRLLKDADAGHAFGTEWRIDSY